MPLLRLFVYGSLVRGGKFHHRYIKPYVKVARAAVQGNLLILPEGYKALVESPRSLLHTAGKSPQADLARNPIPEGPARPRRSLLAPERRGPPPPPRRL